MDPAKMKVVDLRSELGALGLDTKGNKPALVERLKKALEARTGKNLPDSSILDTSTEDVDEVTTPRKPALRTTRRSSSSRLTGSTPAKVPRQEPPQVIPEKVEKEASPPPKASPQIPKPLAELPEPEEKQPEEKHPEVKQPEAKQPEAKRPEAKQPEAKQPEENQPEETQPEENKPEEIQPKEKQPEEKHPEEKHPKENQPEPMECQDDNSQTSAPSLKEEDSKPVETMDVDQKQEATINDNKGDGDHKDEKEEKPVENEDIREDERRDEDTRNDDISDEDRRDEDRREERERQERELTEEEEWDLLNEKLIIKEKERIEREKKQAEEDAKRFEELSEDPIKLQRLKRKFERKARWSNYYRIIEATNEILTPPVESVPMLQKKEEEQPEKPVEPELDDNKVTLSWYDSDLNQYLELPELKSVVALSEGAFAYAWAGARASHGVRGQRVCFEVRVGSVVTTNEVADKETMPINGLRIGWSTEDSNLHLGDGELSFGYESTGRCVNAGEFKEYGKTFTEKDVIGAYVDLQSNPCRIFYTLNGVELGDAFEFEQEKLGDRALFPHVLTKNICYKVNMGYERYNLLTRTKIVRKRIEIPIAEVLEEKRKKEEEIKKKKEEQIKKRQERQKKRREEREKAEREKKEKEALENKDDEEKADTAMDTDADGKENEEEKKEEIKDEAMENGEKPEEAQAEVKTELKEDEAKDEENKEESGEVEDVSEEQVLSGITLDKRVKFVFRHTVDEELDGEEASLVAGFVLVAHAQLDAGPRRPSCVADCEVILMVGMPGSGKTYWAKKHCQDNPHKRYNILSTGTLFDKMKVDCKPFRTSYEGRWDAMVSKCAKCVLKLLEMAQGRRRNFILDQTNVYPSAQRRKLREFEGYRRVAVVIVPEASVLAERQASRETTDGKEVPDPAVIDMKANFTLPEKGTFVDEVIYAELDEEEAKKVIEEYHKEAKAAGVVKEREKRERSAARETQSARPRSDDRRRDRDDKRRDGGRDRDRWSSGGSRWGPGAGMGGPPGGMGGRGGRWGPPGGGPRDRNWPQPRNDFGRERDFRGRGPGGPPGPMGGMGPMGPGGPRQDRGPRGPMDRGFGRDRSQNNRPPPNQQDKRPGPGGLGASVGQAGPPGPGPVGASSGPSGSWQRGSVQNQRGTNRPAQNRPNPNNPNQNQKDSGNNQMANQNQAQHQQAWNQWSGAWGGWGGNWGNQNQGWGNWNNWGWGNNQQNNGGQQGNAGKGNQNSAQSQNAQWGGYTAQQWYQWQQWQQQQQGWPGQYNTGGQTASGGNQQGTSAADQAQAWAQYYQHYGAGNAAGGNTNSTASIENKK